jgi:ribosomal protein L39E
MTLRPTTRGTRRALARCNKQGQEIPQWLIDACERQAEAREERRAFKPMAHGMIPSEIRRTVRSCAIGGYQDWLLSGYEKWSGAGLKGKAKHFSASYARSRANLIARINKKLDKHGWEAETRLVFNPQTKRTERVLILEGPGGGKFRW